MCRGGANALFPHTADVGMAACTQLLLKDPVATVCQVAVSLYIFQSFLFVCFLAANCFKIHVSLKRHNRTKTKTTTDHEPDIPGCVPWLYLPGAAGSTVWVEWTVLLFSDPSVSSPLSESAVWMTELAVVPTPAEVSQLSHVALRFPSRVSNWFVPPFP